MSSLHWPPLPPDLIADPQITDRCFRAFARLYAQAWNGNFLTPVCLTEEDLCALLHKSRAQMYSLLTEMKTANLIHWHRDGRHFRITPNFQPPVPTQSGGHRQESGNPDSAIFESGNPDTKPALSLDFQTQSLESRIRRQGKKSAALKELIKFNDDDESSEDQHHHPRAGESGNPDSAALEVAALEVAALEVAALEAVRAQAETWLIRTGVWNDRAEKLAHVLAENEILRPHNAHLPTRADLLGWLVALKLRDDVYNLPAILAQNLEMGRTAPAKYRPPRICQTCQRAEGFCRCAQATYHSPEALLDRALDPTVHSWVCSECHTLPCACPSEVVSQPEMPEEYMTEETTQKTPMLNFPVVRVGWHGSEIEPEQAWKSAMDELQNQISKPTYDKWVKDTYLVQWENQGNQALFIVRCPNAYIRDWLTERITHTLIHILVGVCNHQVAVKFILDDDSHTLVA